jgi:phosphate transport system substrate-binding protein
MTHFSVRKLYVFSESKRKAVSNGVFGAVVVVLLIVAAGSAYYGLSASSTKTVTTTVTVTGTQTTTSTTNTVSANLNGAGSTFIFPVLSSIITAYQTANPGTSINYQGIGSGGGISALEAKTVNFAASDAPLGSADIAKLPTALTIPATIGAVTVAYNVKNSSGGAIPTGLHLTGKVIADIFAANVTQWNDPEIASLNPGVALPSHSIIVVHRSDSSGTTFTFTGYLSAVSPAWKSAIGQGKSVAWPGNPLGANGNAGVAGVVQGTTYTIGYVELAYALQNKLPVASVQNHDASAFVPPNLNTSAAAAAAVTSLPAANQAWTTVNLLNEPGASTYPIVTFSYILVPSELNVETGLTQSQATALVNFLWYAVHTGQQQAAAQAYVPLPANVLTIDEAGIRSITFNGQPVFSG